MAKLIWRLGGPLLTALLLTTACSSTPQEIVTGDDVAPETETTSPTTDWLTGTAWTLTQPATDAPVTLSFMSGNSDFTMAVTAECTSAAAVTLIEVDAASSTLQVSPTMREDCGTEGQLREQLAGVVQDLRVSLTDDGLLRIVTESGEEFLAKHPQSDSAHGGADLPADQLRHWVTNGTWWITEMHGFEFEDSRGTPFLRFQEHRVLFMPCNTDARSLRWVDGGFEIGGTPTNFGSTLMYCGERPPQGFGAIAGPGELVEVNVTEGRLELRNGDRLVIADRNIPIWFAEMARGDRG